MFVRRRPELVVGGLLLTIVAAVGRSSRPPSGTVDPRALSTGTRLRAPSAAHWFGTEMLGRDVYSRVLYGGRISLLIGRIGGAALFRLWRAVGLLERGRACFGHCGHARPWMESWRFRRSCSQSRLMAVPRLRPERHRGVTVVEVPRVARAGPPASAVASSQALMSRRPIAAGFADLEDRLAGILLPRHFRTADRPGHLQSSAAGR